MVPDQTPGPSPGVCASRAALVSERQAEVAADRRGQRRAPAPSPRPPASISPASADGQRRALSGVAPGQAQPQRGPEPQAERRAGGEQRHQHARRRAGRRPAPPPPGPTAAGRRARRPTATRPRPHRPGPAARSRAGRLAAACAQPKLVDPGRLAPAPSSHRPERQRRDVQQRPQRPQHGATCAPSEASQATLPAASAPPAA